MKIKVVKDAPVKKSFIGQVVNSRVSPLSSSGSASSIISGGNSGSGIPIDNYENVVFIGASLIQSMFGSDLDNPNEIATQELNAHGIEGVNVYGAGSGGDSARDIAARVPAILEKFPSKTLFVVHTGGNNVSASRPFNPSNDGTLSNSNEWPAIISNFKGREDDVVYANISFRSYGKTGELAADDYIEDEHGGANLYNTEYLNELIASQGGKSMLGNGILVDMYNHLRNNYQTYLVGDGVHETSQGITGTRGWLYTRIAHILDSSMTQPQPLIPASYPSWVDPTNTNPNRVDINLGGSSNVQNNISFNDLEASTTISLLKPDGTESGVSIQATGVTSGEFGYGTKGVACNRPDADTLFSDRCTYTYMFSKTSNATFNLIFSGLSPSTSYSLELLNGKGDSFIASVEGVDLNTPTSDIANIASTPVMSDTNGELDINIRVAGSYDYLCGLGLTPS